MPSTGFPEKPTKSTARHFIRTAGAAMRYEVSRATVFRWIRQGILPPPVRLTPGVTGWFACDLDAWDQSKRKEAQPSGGGRR